MRTYTNQFQCIRVPKDYHAKDSLINFTCRVLLVTGYIITASTVTLLHLCLFQDILENDDIKLDWVFKNSLITDLVNVSIGL